MERMDETLIGIVLMGIAAAVFVGWVLITVHDLGLAEEANIDAGLEYIKNTNDLMNITEKIGVATRVCEGVWGNGSTMKTKLWGNVPSNSVDACVYQLVLKD